MPHILGTSAGGADEARVLWSTAAQRGLARILTLSPGGTRRIAGTLRVFCQVVADLVCHAHHDCASRGSPAELFEIPFLVTQPGGWAWRYLRAEDRPVVVWLPRHLATCFRRDLALAPPRK